MVDLICFLKAFIIPTQMLPLFIEVARGMIPHSEGDIRGRVLSSFDKQRI